MNIGIDMMGGDYAPLEAVKGVQSFFENSTDTSVHLTLIGDTQAVSPYLSCIEAYQNRYTFVHTPSVIEMNEHPTKAFKEKPDSSIAVGFGMLGMKKIDAFIGAGNTGAMLVGAMYSVKTVQGLLLPPLFLVKMASLIFYWMLVSMQIANRNISFNLLN
jgi:glycerol-3-phosphate acyltransferase PlsX